VLVRVAADVFSGVKLWSGGQPATREYCSGGSGNIGHIAVAVVRHGGGVLLMPRQCGVVVWSSCYATCQTWAADDKLVWRELFGCR